MNNEYNELEGKIFKIVEKKILLDLSECIFAINDDIIKMINLSQNGYEIKRSFAIGNLSNLILGHILSMWPEISEKIKSVDNPIIKKFFSPDKMIGDILKIRLGNIYEQKN